MSTKRFSAWMLALGIVTGAFGFLSLAGWVSGWLQLASFGATRIPMAPSTAVLFLLYGTAIGVSARTPLSRRTFRMCMVAGWLGALVSLLFSVLSNLDIHLGVEHFGLNLTETVGGAPIGHMSPVTALCFLLASVSFLASLSPSAIRRWRVVLAFGALGVLLAAIFIFLLAYCFGTPLLYGGEFIPPALNTILAFSTLGLALLALAGRSIELFRKLPGADSKPAFIFVLIFFLLALGIVGTGYAYYRNYERQYRAEAEQQIASIADLKVGELVQYRKERLGDAAILNNNPAFILLVRRFLASPADADAQQHLQAWLGKYQSHYQYDQIRLLDAQGVTCLSAPSGLEPVSSVVVRGASEALRLDQVVFQDFYRSEHDKRIYLGMLIPIFDELDGNRPLGVLVLRVDPATYLYPFISLWPVSSATAETLLLRREGTEAVFLNELRFQKNTALTLRSPLANTNMPAVKAVLGQEGIVTGSDYRNMPVLAAVRAVPDSPWFMVARRDVAEVYAPLSAQLWQMIALIGTLVFGAGAGVGLVWRQQRVRFYRGQAEAAEELRLSEMRYRRLFESAKDGILILDAETGLVVDVNPFLEEMLGYSHKTFLAKRIWELGFFKNKIANQSNFEELQRNEYIRNEDMSLESADGRRIEVEFISNVYLVNEKKVIQCNIRDITESKRAEEAVRTSQQLIEEIINAIPVRIFWKGKNLLYLGCNVAFAHDAGFAGPQDIIGKDDYQLLPAQAELYRDDDRQVIESGCAKLLIEEPQTTPSGNTITLLTSKIPLRDAQGEIIGIIGVYMDITERKRAEEELQNLRKAVEQSANTVIITDADGDMEYVNPAFERSTGYTKAEAIGQNTCLLKSGMQDEAFYRDLWVTIKSGKTWKGEFHSKSKDGASYWESATISPVQNDKGEILHFIAIKADITEKKAMDESLKEALVLAEAGNRAKSEFFGIMSHELRTPLNGVLGSSELLTYTPLDKEQESLVGTVSKCGEHLLEIVKDILDFSSMEAGKLAIEVAPMAVAEVVEQSALLVQTSAAEKGLAFRCETSRDVPHQIVGDALRIRQILINLLGNAVKFTSGGSVVFLVEPDAEGRHLNFSVEDTGIGISSETIGLLFKPFTQADSTTTRAFGGTGLGLAISKRLAEAMGGSITVASIPGKGSTFTFHFPLESSPVCAEGMASVPSPVSDREKQTDADTEPRPPAQTGGTPHEGKLVLVVEDDPENALTAGRMLQSLGYRAEFATNGAEAVEACAQRKYFAILMDVVMPMMDGVEATKKIREIEATAGGHMPIIAFTANVMPGDRERCLAAGMDDFLTKPFKRAELAAKLASFQR